MKRQGCRREMSTAVDEMKKAISFSMPKCDWAPRATILYGPVLCFNATKAKGSCKADDPLKQVAQPP